MTLPGDAAAAAVRADRAPGSSGPARPAADAIAAATARAGRGRRLPRRRDRARAFAAALGGRLPTRSPTGCRPPRRGAGARPAVGPGPGATRRRPALVPPPVPPNSPLLALVDSKADATHPEFAGGNVVTLRRLGDDRHGTGTAAVAAAPEERDRDGRRLARDARDQVPLPEGISCSDSSAASPGGRAGAAVINMSYGSTDLCLAEYVLLQAARAGVTLVAAAGNEAQGNPLSSRPPCRTCSRSRPSAPTCSRRFLERARRRRLASAGVGILTAAPSRSTRTAPGRLQGRQRHELLRADGRRRGRMGPQVRPELTVDQISQVIRLSAPTSATRARTPRPASGCCRDGALARTPPVADPQEPNEDIGWVDGRALGKATAHLQRWQVDDVSSALLDEFEDPGDVYRIACRPTRVRVSIEPSFGNPDLAAYTAAPGRSERRAGHRPLTAQRAPHGLAHAAQPVPAVARGLPRRLHPQRQHHARTRATTSASVASSAAEPLATGERQRRLGGSGSERPGWPTSVISTPSWVAETTFVVAAAARSLLLPSRR